MTDPTMDFSALDAAFLTDKKAESDGAWCDYNADISVRLRRSVHPLFRAALRKSFRRFKHMGSAMTPEQEDMVKDEAVAKALIVEWRIKGLPAAYTPEAGLAAFKRLPDFRRWCEEQGDDRDNFQTDVDADEGNSSGSSLGSESGDNPND